MTSPPEQHPRDTAPGADLPSNPARPRLLFLSQCLPYPPDGGVKIRTYHILRLLASAFDITALCFYRAKGVSGGEDVESAVEALSDLAHVEAFPIPQEHGRGRFVLDNVRSLIERRVYTRYVYASAPYRRRLTRLLRDARFDLVHADSLDLAVYFPMIDGIPLVCVHHDAQSVLLSRRARHSRGLMKSYLAYQARRMAAEERLWCPRVSLNVTVSDEDSKALKALAPDGRFVTVPNGVDTGYFQPTAGAQSGMVFVGGTSWFPNKDALGYYRRSILPVLRSEGVTARTIWVGRATEDEQRSAGLDTGVELTGYVEDIRPHVARAACYVVPLRIGGGTRIKILDAWAMGKAVVSTSIGCEGLQAVDGENILIRDDPAAFAQAVGQILGDPDLRQRLGRAGRATVQAKYSWEAIGRPMVQKYKELMT